MKDYFNVKRDFSSLSVQDLLEARDAYHVHLSHLDNVVATAIGRYRIRRADPDAKSPEKRREDLASPQRTLANSDVKPWSWPCVLVFVREWSKPSQFDKSPEQFVPPLLYMPNGRVVPTCTVLVEDSSETMPALQDLTFPSELIGGGYPVLTEVQAKTHIGSLGCLVTDGETSYALTNRHVTGEAGRPVYTIVGGKRTEIGVSDSRQIGKKPFPDVYPGWPGTRAVSNIDAGLIRVIDLNYWTAQVFGIGEIDTLADLHPDTISLDLIGCPVRGFGCASGEMSGQIDALFYRYKSVGGFEYIADLLIGPREKQPMNTQPGDSGTLWFFDPEGSKTQAGDQQHKGVRARRYRPVALQWGGHELMVPGGEIRLRFALATFVSTICRELDVEIIRDWNIGHNEYWGKTGHYKIAAKACQITSNTKLKNLLSQNLDRISFDDESIRQGQLRRIRADQFVPLADVPDLVWRSTRKKDEANHFADMDEVGKGEFAGKTLLQLCQDTKNVSVSVWNRFYDSIGVGYKRGALPFRVWQMYDAMVGYVKAGKVAEFLCTAGIMAHYVGDACQPLHISRLHHGTNEAEANVHSAYETAMLDQFAPEVIDGVNTQLKTAKTKPAVKGGHAAAVSVVRLMGDTIKALPPMDIISAFNETDGRGRTQHMWDVLGERTIKCVAAGCIALATLWESAWKEGSGNSIPQTKLAPIDPKILKQLYYDQKFLPALRLKEMQLT